MIGTVAEAPRGLAVGLDLPWQGPYGIVNGQVAERTVRFLQENAHRFVSLFISWQPRDRGAPELSHVQEAWDALFEAVPIPHRMLHQTALNLAGTSYDRSAVIAFTNAVCERYGFLWVNEDLGNWSVQGRPLPYPQPPPLTAHGVAHCTHTVREVQTALAVPLVVEFPGFEQIPNGELDAYDAFRQIVQGSGTRCNLDTGHLLTWRWLQGHRGTALLEGLDRLPLANCVELHCAGTEILGDTFIDAHHGVLVDIQLELASRLMELCPNLHIVTYEDPRYDATGQLPEAASHSLQALEARTATWLERAQESIDLVEVEGASAPAQQAPWETDLLQVFAQSSEQATRWRAQVLDRQARGVGRIRDLFAEHLGPDPDGTVAGFLASEHGAAWSEFAWARPGLCVEDAFGRFVARGSPAHLLACARVLAVHPDPPFEVPEGFRKAPAGWFQVCDGVLYAACGGKLIHGPVTPMLVAVLEGGRPSGSAPVVSRFQALGLIA